MEQEGPIDIDTLEPHGSWFPIEVTYPGFQHAAWRCGTTGEVIMVEDYVNNTGRYDSGILAVVILEENFRENPHPVEVLDVEPTTIEGALSLARKYMDENPDG